MVSACESLQAVDIPTTPEGRSQDLHVTSGPEDCPSFRYSALTLRENIAKQVQVEKQGRVVAFVFVEQVAFLSFPSEVDKFKFSNFRSASRSGMDGRVLDFPNLCQLKQVKKMRAAEPGWCMKTATTVACVT